MAIQLEHYETTHGISLNSAYVLIESITGKSFLSYTIFVYVSESARRSQKKPIDTKTFSFLADFQSQENFIEQAYANLKSLATFAEYQNV